VGLTVGVVCPPLSMPTPVLCTPMVVGGAWCVPLGRGWGLYLGGVSWVGVNSGGRVPGGG